MFGFNTECMLAYSLVAHDVQTLREVYDRNPAPEFAEWALNRDIFQRDSDGNLIRGPQWETRRSSMRAKPSFRNLPPHARSLRF